MTAPAPTQALDPTEVMVGTANGAGLWLAPPGTPAPESIDDPFELPWRPLGYASDDGVTLGGDTTTEQFTPWQSAMPIRTIITERTATIGFTLWQLNHITLGLYFDMEIPEPSGGSWDFSVRSDAPARLYAVVVDARDGDMHFRVLYGRANLDSTGDMVLQRGAMVPLDVTLSALDNGGEMRHVWLNDAAAEALQVTATEQTAAAQTAATEQAA
jgi:hypothetical protein